MGSAVPTLEITELYSTGVLKKSSTAKVKAIETTLREKTKHMVENEKVC